ncbi:hypothetical protein [Pendulispora albinea]|uniref:Uncharacterized protein n=1 Tax=Pendulispora albinea TaxID=2741071 RepID=A0ABZ2LT21_9BACT
MIRRTASQRRWSLRFPSQALALAALTQGIVHCSIQRDSAPPAEGDSAAVDSVIQGKGTVDAAWLRARKNEYLRFATRTPDGLGNPVTLLAHVARARLDPPYQLPPIPASVVDSELAKMAALNDGRDFIAIYLLNVLYGYGDQASFPPEVRLKIENALADFKFWYTEPTPDGKKDEAYYWTENHQAIFATIEYLVGQRLPERALGTDRRPGKEHAADARERLLRWIDQHFRYGFAEWHSNVYYQKDIVPLLTLVEYANDAELRTKASMVLDLLFVDLGLHTFRDAFGVTHGRSYKKDKMMSTDEDTWGLTKIVFNRSKYDFDTGDPGATVFAATTRYRLPEIVRRVGLDPRPVVDREHIGLTIPEALPVEQNPQAPGGFSFTNPKDYTVWTGMGAYITWPVLPLTVQMANQYNLWDKPPFNQFELFRYQDPAVSQQLTAGYTAILNFGLLQGVDTYTYRTGDSMLSSAVDYRKGTFNNQMHSWQATFDARALVFTNHPFRPLAQSGDWLDDPEEGGYWNGEATAPRSAQHKNVAIHIYAPQYPQQNPPPLEYYHYEPYTHAYFPQDYFDEVVQKGQWTFGRFGSGYVALYSHRPAAYKIYNGTTEATGGRVKPFDLIANGGADNVWLVEVGRQADSGSFEQFQQRILAAKVDITSRGPGKPTGESDGFDVSYASPSQGLVTFGWEAPLVVNGQNVELHPTDRYDNRYGRTPGNSNTVDVRDGDYWLHLDIAKGERILCGPSLAAGEDP